MVTKTTQWKKFQTNHWKKGKSNVMVLNINEFKSDKRDKRKGYVVYSNRTNGFFGNPYGKKFDTKAEAVRKAKLYMKTKGGKKDC